MKKLLAILLSAALIFGSAASVFAASSKGTAASVKLEKVTGTVTVTNASGTKVTAREGMLLYTGYKIKTGSKSSAYISLDNKTALMLESSSKMSLKKAGSKSEVMLESGTVVTDIAEKLPATSSVNIHTTNAVTGIRGTGVEISYDPVTGATSLGMLEGSTDSFSKFLDSFVHADAGQGFILGGAVQVTPLAGSITINDLQPETRKIMIVDEDASGRVLTGFRETFGINGMTDQQKEDLKQDILNDVNEQGDKYESADKAADDAAKTILDEGAVGSSSRPFEQVDPVFEDKDQVSASGAVSAASLPDGIPEDTPDAAASSGSESSGSSTGGGSQQTTNYTVSLYYEPAGTGAEPEQIQVRRGSAASLPSEYDGSPIVCWCSDSDLTTEFDPATPITSSISLYARFEPFVTHRVTYEAEGNIPNGFEVPKEMTCNVGATVSLASVSAQEGYIFDGWYYNSEIVSSFAMPDEDVVVSGTWKMEANYTVRHMLQDLGSDGYTEAEDERETLKGIVGEETEAEAKVIDGFEAMAVDQQIVASGDETVIDVFYNRLSYNLSYTVSGDVPADYQVPAQTSVVFGDTVSIELPEEYEEYDFDGWYNGSAKITESLAMPAGDVELSGTWAKKMVVTFNYIYKEGSEPYSEQVYVSKGSSVTLPTTDSTGTYSVNGWYSDPELEYQFSSTTPVNANIRLYASLLTHQVYFSYFPKDDVHFNSTMINVIHGLSVLDTVDAEDINSFPIYDDNGEETGEYITVENWYIDENGKTEFDLSTAITENKTLYAKGYANNNPYAAGVFTFRIPAYDSEMFAVSVTSGDTAVSGESDGNYTSYSVEGDSVTVDVTLLAGSDFARNGNGTGLQDLSEYGISSSSVGASSDGLLMHYVFNEMPENGILYYDMDLTVDQLTDNNYGEITKFISGLQNSSIVGSATISCYSGDEAALGELIGSYGNVSLGTPYHRVTFVYTENNRSNYDVKDGQKVERPSDSFEGDPTVVVSSWHVDSSPDAAEFDFDDTITSDWIIYSDLVLVSKP
ncbi:MAG: InlB B-repeat-containing protein [Firmicutes bacterium]|nr:InlB B-repeat-containing protein [Bacillota bacterium]